MIRRLTLAIGSAVLLMSPAFASGVIVYPATGQSAEQQQKDEGERVSEIELVDHLDGDRMSLQGTDGEHSWSMLISGKTGSMTVAVAGEEVGFVVFGACTPR